MERIHAEIHRELSVRKSEQPLEETLERIIGRILERICYGKSGEISPLRGILQRLLVINPEGIPGAICVEYTLEESLNEGRHRENH